MSDTSDYDDYESEDAFGSRQFWLRELPYLAILALTLGGVAYISMARRPLIGYWEFMAVSIAVICVATGWRSAGVGAGRWRLIWTQALHWGAFLVAMNLVLLPSVQAIADSDTTSLTILLLLSLGTFVAGVHIGSWRMCANGAVMALCVPAIAWLDQSALFVALMAIALAGAAFVFVWWRREKRAAPIG